MNVDNQEAVSDPDATLDSMVEEASIPTLSTLFQRAKDAGHIKPVAMYGSKPMAGTATAS